MVHSGHTLSKQNLNGHVFVLWCRRQIWKGLPNKGHCGLSNSVTSNKNVDKKSIEKPRNLLTGHFDRGSPQPTDLQIDSIGLTKHVINLYGRHPWKKLSNTVTQNILYDNSLYAESQTVRQPYRSTFVWWNTCRFLNRYFINQSPAHQRRWSSEYHRQRLYYSNRVFRNSN